MYLLVYPLARGLHQDNMWHRTFRQILNQFPVVDSPVHAAYEYCIRILQRLKGLDGGVANRGDGVVIIFHALLLPNILQPVGKGFVRLKPPGKYLVIHSQYAAHPIGHADVKIIMLSQQLDFIRGYTKGPSPEVNPDAVLLLNHIQLLSAWRDRFPPLAGTVRCRSGCHPGAGF